MQKKPQGGKSKAPNQDQMRPAGQPGSNQQRQDDDRSDPRQQGSHTGESSPQNQQHQHDRQ
ncbi:MAG: hypothetical protein JWR16_1842 [Nevskia sp.]|nr:hypothetical protein [Nevskia sp.]